MDLQKAKEIFNQLYHDIDGYKISKLAVSKLPYKYNANIYGEVLFDSFQEILKLANPQKGENFYDLGSGTGRPSIIAYLCFEFAKVVGIEKLYNLYSVSNKLSHRLKSDFSSKLSLTKLNSILDFIHSDFNECDFTDADIIFTNSYYFQYELNNRYFLDKLLKLKKGSRVITLKIPFNTDLFKVEEYGPYTFSWGDEFILLNTKIT